MTTLDQLTEDDRCNLLAMFNTVMGGGVAPVDEDEAKRLESLGLVKLGPATAEDIVPGETLPDYTFTLTEQGESLAREYRASW